MARIRKIEIANFRGIQRLAWCPPRAARPALQAEVVHLVEHDVGGRHERVRGVVAQTVRVQDARRERVKLPQGVRRELALGQAAVGTRGGHVRNAILTTVSPSYTRATTPRRSPFTMARVTKQNNCEGGSAA